MVHNFLHTAVVEVQTEARVGTAGPIRIDFDGAFGVMYPYKCKDARAAFARSEKHHKTEGW